MERALSWHGAGHALKRLETENVDKSIDWNRVQSTRHLPLNAPASYSRFSLWARVILHTYVLAQIAYLVLQIWISLWICIRIRIWIWQSIAVLSAERHSAPMIYAYLDTFCCRWQAFNLCLCGCLLVSVSVRALCWGNYAHHLNFDFDDIGSGFRTEIPTYLSLTQKKFANFYGFYWCFLLFLFSLRLVFAN